VFDLDDEMQFLIR